jgi:hypothetical protein
MEKIKLTNDCFEKLLKQCLTEIDNNIIVHVGVLSAMHKRLQFEKWLQIELFKQLKEKLKNYRDLEILIEAESDQKTNKRGKSIDVVILQESQKFIGLELKIIPTNYLKNPFEKKSKKISNIVNDFIFDLDKTSSFIYSYSLAFIFPFPINLENRNFKDFKRQETRMEEKGTLAIWDGLQMNDFITRYYLLSKKN